MTDKMVASRQNVGISPREEVEQVLAVYAAPGQVITYQEYEAVYAELREVIADPNDCNIAALSVFQFLDAEDLPPGITKDVVVVCAKQARGDDNLMQELFDKHCSELDMDDVRYSGYSAEERERGVHLSHEALGTLRAPGDDPDDYFDEEVESPVAEAVADGLGPENEKETNSSDE